MKNLLKNILSPLQDQLQPHPQTDYQRHHRQQLPEKAPSSKSNVNTSIWWFIVTRKKLGSRVFNNNISYIFSCFSMKTLKVTEDLNSNKQLHSVWKGLHWMFECHCWIRSGLSSCIFRSRLLGISTFLVKKFKVSLDWIDKCLSNAFCLWRICSTYLVCCSLC